MQTVHLTVSPADPSPSVSATVIVPAEIDCAAFRSDLLEFFRTWFDSTRLTISDGRDIDPIQAHEVAVLCDSDGQPIGDVPLLTEERFWAILSDGHETGGRKHVTAAEFEQLNQSANIASDGQWQWYREQQPEVKLECLGPGAYQLGPVRINRLDQLPSYRAWVWYDSRDQAIHSDGSGTLREAVEGARAYLR